MKRRHQIGRTALEILRDHKYLPVDKRGRLEICATKLHKLCSTVSVTAVTVFFNCVSDAYYSCKSIPGSPARVMEICIYHLFLLPLFYLILPIVCISSLSSHMRQSSDVPHETYAR